MDGISQKVDAALANQRLIDCLQNNCFLNRLSSTRSSVPEAAEKNRINFNVHATLCWKCIHVHGKELTIAELDALRNFEKKRGTTVSYFAVFLLKEYTTPEERMNCSVYGEGPKSKGLHTDTLMKI
jgi:hypothetical protein